MNTNLYCLYQLTYDNFKSNSDKNSSKVALIDASFTPSPMYMMKHLKSKSVVFMETTYIDIRILHSFSYVYDETFQKKECCFHGDYLYRYTSQLGRKYRPFVILKLPPYHQGGHTRNLQSTLRCT